MVATGIVSMSILFRFMLLASSSSFTSSYPTLRFKIFVGSSDLSLFWLIFVFTCWQNIVVIMQLYRMLVLSDANLAKGSIQQCEWTQHGKHLTMSSLDWNDHKWQLGLNDVAITEHLGFALLKSNVAVWVYTWIANSWTFTDFNPPFLSLQVKKYWTWLSSVWTYEQVPSLIAIPRSMPRGSTPFWKAISWPFASFTGVK